MSTVDSWSRTPDQIQMYPDRDTIAQLLPARRLFFLFLLYDCLWESLNIYYKTLNVWSLLKLVSFAFPRVLMFPSTSSRETLGLSGQQN